MCFTAREGASEQTVPLEQWQDINRNYVSGGLNLFDFIYAELSLNDESIRSNYMLFDIWLLNKIFSKWL